MAGVSTIDPRLRQRRIAVRRAAGRRRLRVLLIVLGVLVVAGASWATTRSALLDLDTVDVAGAFGSEADAVRDAAGLTIGAPMLDLDLESATAGVVALPWVRSASVDRRWPGRVEIVVERRLGAAVLPAGDGSWVVVDDEGIAIANRPVGATPGLPIITLLAAGDLGDEQIRAHDALALVTATPDDLWAWVDSTVVVADGPHGSGLQFDLIGSASAWFGANDHLPEKIEALRAVLASVDLRCVTEIFVDVADHPRLSRDAQCDAAAGATSG